jgi:N-glycosylase/DNA lyase
LDRSFASLDRQVNDPIDLAATLNSGQVFHWLETPTGFAGCIGDVPIHLKARDRRLVTGEANLALVRRYLGLEHPLEQILATFPTDPVMQAAVNFSPGLRIIEQPIWECLATFLSSALKQISQIRTISYLLRTRFGRQLYAGRFPVFTYPEPATLARLELADLLLCKLGFRAGNVQAAAKLVDSGAFDLEALRHCSTDEARAKLCLIPGVGAKIANCVLLFAYQRFEAFPIDVWVERVLRDIYFAGDTQATAKKMQMFATEYFGPFAGYAQQYLFHFWRLTHRKGA